MDPLCELSGCLCLTFELRAIKISKAETAIKYQSLAKSRTSNLSIAFPVWQLKGKNFGCGSQDDIIIEINKTMFYLSLPAPGGTYMSCRQTFHCWATQLFTKQGHHFTGRETKYLIYSDILNPHIKPQPLNFTVFMRTCQRHNYFT